MAFKYGKSNVSEVKYDGKSVNTIYYGTKRIFGKAVELDSTTAHSYLKFEALVNNTCAVSLKEDATEIDIDIPETITVNGSDYDVTVILEEGFRGSSIQTVTIPKTIVSIGARAFQQCQDLTTVIIAKDSNLSEIQHRAFRGCLSLKQINLQDATKLSTIQKYTFARCPRLTKIILPDKVTKIEESAFRWCIALKNIRLPAELTTIEARAFSFCWILEDIYLPSTITYIGFNTFNACHLLKIYCGFSKENSNFGTGWKLDINPKEWDIPVDRLFTYELLEDDTYQITDSITSCLTADLQIPSTYTGSDGIPREVTRIGNSAFEDAEFIQKVTIPPTIKYIGDQAFKQCYNLKSIYFSEGWDTPSKLISIGAHAFSNCKSLVDINRPKNGAPGWSTLPDNLEEIDNNAFEYCKSLNRIVFPDSLKYVGPDIFWGCTEDILISCPFNSQPNTWNDSWNKLNSLLRCKVVWTYEGDFVTNDGVFKQVRAWFDNEATIKGFDSDDTTLTKISIPSTITANNKTYKVTTIGKKAFKDCEHLEQVILPEGITTIKKYAFKGCSNLTRIVIPDSVTSIGDGVFENCTSLKSITLGKNITFIANEAFCGCTSLTDIAFPENDLYVLIGEKAFYNTGLENLEIPANIGTIGVGAFGCNTKLSSITFAENSKLEFIKSRAFSGEDGDDACINLKEITIPNSVSEIGPYTFAGCTALSGVTLSDKLTWIDDHAFFKCSALESITIPASVKGIGEWAFAHCTELESALLASDSKLYTIEKGAFYDCDSLTEDGIVSIITHSNSSNNFSLSPEAFSECDNLINSTLLSRDSSTGTLVVGFANIFSNAEAISNLIAIGSKAISNIDFNLANIVNFTFPQNIKTIYSYALFNCRGLKSIKIHSGVKYIWANAFKNCGTAEERPTIYCAAPSKPKTWADDWNPDNLPVVWNYVDGAAADDYLIYDWVDESHTAYSVRARDINNLPSSRLIIPGYFQGVPVTTIKASGFEGCNISRVEILPGVKTIEDKAFKDCKVMWDINFPDTLEYIGENAFQNCIALELIQLPDKIKTIKTLAFNNCGTHKDALGRTDGVMNIYIPSSAQTIEDGAFLSINSANCVIWCEDTEAQIVAKEGWGEYWASSTVLDGIFGTPYTIHYNAAAVTDSSKFDFSDSLDGGYRIQPVDNSTAESMVIVHIPSSYNGKPVTEIGNFGKCKNLVKIILPNTITTIRGGAFSGCYNLNKINLPASLKSIKNYAFGASAYDDYDYTGPSGITEIVIPDTVENNSSDTYVLFNQCRQLRHVELPENWTHIGDRMFDSCEMLTDIVIPNDCVYIGANAFRDCTNLQNVYLYHKQWKVNGEILDLTTKTSEEVAQLLKSAQYYQYNWSVLKAAAPVLSVELDEHYVEFTIENTNDAPQVATVSLILKDSSTGNIKEVYDYSDTFTISADQSITEVFDMPVNVDDSGKYSILPFTYAEIIAKFETSEEVRVTRTLNNDQCTQNGHTYIDTIIAPTCTTKGYTKHECLVCGNSYNDYVEALGHTLTEVIGDIRITPDCTTEGLYESIMYCSVCNKEISMELKTMPAEGHDWKETKYTWYDYDSKNGYTSCAAVRDCYKNMDHWEEALAVVTSEIIKAPTCTEAGTRTYTAVFSEDWAENQTKVETLSKLAHDTEWIIDVRPTGLTEGSRHKECTVCGEILATETLAKLENADEYLTYSLFNSEEYSVKATYLDYLPSELIIPSTFNGKLVTVIEMEAFYDADSLTKVILPSSIVAIHEDAFAFCSNLTEVYIPDSVEYIELDAFRECDNLTIYCEADKKPSAWDANWNSSNCNVVWGCDATYLITESGDRLTDEQGNFLVLEEGDPQQINDPIITHHGCDGDDSMTHYFTITNNNDFDVICTWSGGDYGEGTSTTIAAMNSYSCTVADDYIETHFQAQFTYGNLVSNLVSGNYS